MKKSAKKTGERCRKLRMDGCGKYPISARAFDDFSSRIKETLGFDDKACEDGMVMLFNYLNGLEPEAGITDCSEVARIAFMMIRPGIDKAMQRSRLARERAGRRRREGSEGSDLSDLSDLSDKSDQSDLSAWLGCSESSDLPDLSDLSDPSDKSDKSDKSDPSDPSDRLWLNRRERRAYERAVARDDRRFARKSRRLQLSS